MHTIEPSKATWISDERIPELWDPEPILLQNSWIRIHSCSEASQQRSNKSCFGIELEAFTAPTHINIVKIQRKDEKIIRLLEKTRIRIHFGSGQKSPKSCSSSWTGVCSSLARTGQVQCKILQSRFICVTCNAPLCLTRGRNCFKQYHQTVNFQPWKI